MSKFEGGGKGSVDPCPLLQPLTDIDIVTAEDTYENRHYPS
jgi:hypothetical protein